jgi:hypothetical protein
MDKRHLWWVAAFLAGVVFAPQVRKLPLLNKLPSV